MPNDNADGVITPAEASREFLHKLRDDTSDLPFVRRATRELENVWGPAYALLRELEGVRRG